MKHKYKIETYGHGTFYRYATSAAAARQRLAFALFGRCYDGYEHEYWKVEEVPA